MLGSFVMGLLAAATTVGLESKKLVVLLPHDNPWQRMPELHIGLRTGYCGSLTTFASWELSMVQLLIGGPVCPAPYLSQLISGVPVWRSKRQHSLTHPQDILCVRNCKSEQDYAASARCMIGLCVEAHTMLLVYV